MYTNVKIGWLCILAILVLAPTVYAVEQGAWVLSDGTVFPLTEEDEYGLAQSHDFKSQASVVYNGITWNLTYSDVGTNQGFYDPTVGTARRQVLESVLQYISGILNETGGVVDVSIDSYSTDENRLAFAGTTVFTYTPGSFNNGATYQHIMDGSTDPSIIGETDYPDATLTVNFFHNYYLGTGTPGVQEADFYSLLLHEMTHALGYMSVIRYDSLTCSGVAAPAGSGWFGQQPDDYTLFDGFLRTGNGNRLISSSEPLQYVGQLSYLLGSDNGLLFVGPETTAIYGGNVPIYAPASFECGSSVTHWEIGLGAVMEPVLQMGATRRSYADFEVGMLQDIGYTNATTGTTSPCGLQAITLLSPTMDITLSQGESSTAVSFTSSIAFDTSGGCTEGTVEVTYTLNGTDLGSSQNRSANFPLSLNLVAGDYTVLATATVLATGDSRSTTRSFSITATETPQISISPNPSGGYSYGSLEEGTTKDATFTVSNSGQGTLTGTASISGSSAFQIVSGATYSLAAGASSSLQIRFAPSAEGSYSATLTLTGSGISNTTLSLMGIATVPEKDGFLGCGATGGSKGGMKGDLLFFMLSICFLLHNAYKPVWLRRKSK